MQITLKPITYLSPKKIGILSFVLFTIQILQGTSYAFAQNILAFNILFGLAFNFIGGLSSIFGWLMMILAFRQIIISQLVKVFLWQAADLGLKSPVLTSEVYVLGMLAMTLACLTAKFLEPERYSIVKNHFRISSKSLVNLLFIASIGIKIFLGLKLDIPLLFVPLMNALSYVNSVALLAVIYELYRAVECSQGKSIMSFRLAVMLAVLFVVGLTGGSKQLMFEPIFILFLGMVFNHSSIKLRGVIYGVIAGLIMVLVLTPLSDHGRNRFKKESFTESGSELIKYITQNFTSFESYSKYIRAIREESKKNRGDDFYFGNSMFLFDRLALIYDADKLISYYEHIPEEGYEFLRNQLHILPRSLTGLWLDLEDNPGDYFAKKIGVISEDDNQTGVAFGMFAEAFAIAKLWGVFFLGFFISLLLILGLSIIDVTGENRVWSIFLIVYFQQIVGEVGALGSMHIIFRMIPFLIVVKKGVEFLEEAFKVDSNFTNQSLAQY